MNSSFQNSPIPEATLAEYFGVSVKLLPHLDFLLGEYEDLGGDIPLIVDWLREAGIGQNARILDLGCGKGAISIALAKTLGVEAVGCDAFPPFISTANQLAFERGVANRCEFEIADIVHFVEKAHDYDVVVFVSIGGIFGSPQETVSALRSCIKPGGLLLMEYAFAAEEKEGFRAFPDLFTEQETIQQLTAHGDELIRRKLSTMEEMLKMNQRYVDSIASRSKLLKTSHPELTTDLDAYLKREEDACRFIETSVQRATWLLRCNKK